MTESKFDFDEQVASFLAEAEEDFIGLWQICRRTRNAFGAGPDAQNMAFAIVRSLLSADLQAGQFEGFNFEPWSDQNADSVIERIRREWQALGTDPSI